MPDELWKSKQMQSWTHKDIQFVLDSAESLLIDCASSLRVPVSVCSACMHAMHVHSVLFASYLCTPNIASRECCAHMRTTRRNVCHAFLIA